MYGISFIIKFIINFSEALEKVNVRKFFSGQYTVNFHLNYQFIYYLVMKTAVLYKFYFVKFVQCVFGNITGKKSLGTPFNITSLNKNYIYTSNF